MDKLNRCVRSRTCVHAVCFAVVLMHTFASPTKALFLGVGFDFDDSDVYRINETIGRRGFIGPSGVPGLNALAANSAGIFYSVARSSTDVAERPTDRLVTIDPQSGTATVVATLAGITEPAIRALAFAPNDVLFGIHHAATNNTLVRIDTVSGQATVVSPTVASAGMQALDFAADGTLFSWDIFRGLVTIDTSDGTTTDVNTHQGGSPVIQTIAFAADDRLFTIDTNTGAFAQLGSLSLNDIRGMDFLVPEPSMMVLGAMALFLTRTGRNLDFTMKNMKSMKTWITDFSAHGPAFFMSFMLFMVEFCSYDRGALRATLAWVPMGPPWTSNLSVA